MAGGLLRPVKQENVAAAVRRGGRVVDGSGLENRQSASSRGFESHPLRGNHPSRVRIRVAGLNLCVNERFERRWTRGARYAQVRSKAHNLWSQSRPLDNPFASRQLNAQCGSRISDLPEKTNQERRD